MKLDFIDHSKLVPSKVNMRHGPKPPDVGDILPSIRKRGVIVPLIVRPQAGNDNGVHEIVAGRRRWTANAIALVEGIDQARFPSPSSTPGTTPTPSRHRFSRTPGSIPTR